MYRNWSDISTLFWIACSLGLFIGCTLLISESDRQDEEYSQLLEEYLYFCDENFKQFLELEKTNKLKSK